MKKFLALTLAAASTAAAAQTPAVNRMPDGSRDLYIGLGAQSAPRYEGASERHTSALPVLQIEFSNGVFISGMSAGMHLSAEPSLEYGPLLAVQPRRSESGNGDGIGGVDTAPNRISIVQPPMMLARLFEPSGLAGMDPIGARLQAGGFFNWYLSERLRITSSFLYGAGNARKGAALALGVQRVAARVASHHSVSLSAGVTIANRAYNEAFFGVTADESGRSGYLAYEPSAGLKDVHAGARWNWALAPSWIVTSGVEASRLAGSARNSPLVTRPTNLTVSTALAYRF
jgi:outer membrane scaffolding protein for murein synthesis (MipA/OmpV family)